ncbi:putative superfamily III holin-X [Roseiarcus fermentans]|uniref:Putative superfamily III holin-X n=1 Tax=Roseiarcus fermentans TaxID=1473586 RepID=A0A366ERR6_9HYPH|nr:phage holin family protein [Roseiarcus fermentans]RBP04165.1 putative superfamily III holin-X [Roseiarcus fermentans]
MAATDSARPILSLMTEVATDLGHLVQTEFRLARAEMGETFAAVASAGVCLGIGAFVAFAGLIVLLFDIARWITVAGLPSEWSLLIVAGVALVAGGLAAMAGVNRLKASAFVPNRALGQMREDYATARERAR